MTATTSTRAPTGRRRRLFILLRVLISVAALGGLLWWLEPAAMLDAVGPLAPGWVLAGLAISVPQVFVSAWRWRLTAHRLGLDLSLGRAFREYYLATFLNQVLPGGVGGDLSRAWRHATDAADVRGAWHAVLIERVSGQVALIVLAVAALLSSPVLLHSATRFPAAPTLQLAGVIAAFGVAIAWYSRPALTRLWRDLRHSMLARTVLPQQLLASFAVVASYIAVYFCSARAIGVPLPATALLPLIPMVLLAMALPLSVAGWGVREGAAAGLWLLAGLAPAQGMAISVAYGALVFVSSLPGAVMLVFGGLGVAPREGGVGQGPQ